VIIRKLKDIEMIDVGKAFGSPEGTMIIQWIISNETGDARYHHHYAVRKYTLKSRPGQTLDDIPFHRHRYVQSPHILTGKVVFENGDGQKAELGPGDTAFFFENEPHRAMVLGGETAELLCIIDCPNGGEDCVPDKPENIHIKKQ